MDSTVITSSSTLVTIVPRQIYFSPGDNITCYGDANPLADEYGG